MRVKKGGINRALRGTRASDHAALPGGWGGGKRYLFPDAAKAPPFSEGLSFEGEVALGRVLDWPSAVKNWSKMDWLLACA